MGESIAVINYKKSVTKITERWQSRMEAAMKKLAPILDQIEELEAQKPPDEAKLKALRAEEKKVRTEIEGINMSYRTEMMLVEPIKDADPKDKALLDLPDWIEKLIKNKGVSLGKGIVIAPSVKFDFKAGKLKEVGIKITF